MKRENIVENDSKVKQTKTQSDKTKKARPDQRPPHFTKLNAIELEDFIIKLNQLCRKIDPYAEITQKQKELLKEFGIFQFDDPFLLTNQLVALLEDAIEWRMKKQ